MHLFDIIGPVMIGPSSSHTAGAARIGLVARSLLEKEPVRARVGLHGMQRHDRRGRSDPDDRAHAGRSGRCV